MRSAAYTAAQHGRNAADCLRRSMPWSEAHVRRLFWRAGFGATPEEASHWSGAGRQAPLKWLLTGAPDKVVCPEPRVDGKPLDVINTWSHDALWWLDRMVRSQRPLV